MVVDRFVAGRSALLTLTLALAGPVAGCGGELESEITEALFGELGNLYLDYIELLGGADLFFCECAVEKRDYADTRECIAAVGGPVLPPLMAACNARVFDELDGTPAREWLECQIGEYVTYFDCLDAAGCGGDLAACNDLLGDDDCPPLTYAADAALASACLGFEMPPAFVCADGGEIAPWHECNFWPDCADGSDEHDACPNGYACMDGPMIPDPWTCDGVADCPAGDDEANCGG